MKLAFYTALFSLFLTSGLSSFVANNLLFSAEYDLVTVNVPNAKFCHVCGMACLPDSQY
jgi:hypothetical protein